ncbi:IMP dehydrogenase [Candidatus Microgenomates bacterium]|nr:IMP dehydrogenase [Candidatus Microgenomates bacterium]
MKIPLALSFDDVLLVPQKSEIDSRTQVDLTTEIAPGFFLKVPIIATKMATVTGVEMAIAMSKYGGLALIHRFETMEEEAEKVAKVKKAGERVFATVGARDDFLKRAEMAVAAGADGLVFDVANGHMARAVKAVAAIKNRFPKCLYWVELCQLMRGRLTCLRPGRIRC